MLNIGKILIRFIALILGIEDSKSFPPPLSKDEETELFEKMKAGSEAARDRIIEHNLRLVSHIIKKYYSSYENPDELLSIGSLGLIKAVDSFKPGIGTRFATYGARCVQNEILMFFRSKKKRCSEVSINDTIDIDKDGNPQKSGTKPPRLIYSTSLKSFIRVFFNKYIFSGSFQIHTSSLQRENDKAGINY